MTNPLPNDSVLRQRRGKLDGWMLFFFSASSIPVWFIIGASLSGANHFGQGIEGSFFYRLALPFHLASLLGCTFAPFLSSLSLGRRVALAGLGLVAFLAMEFLSFAIIAFGMFPD